MTFSFLVGLQYFLYKSSLCKTSIRVVIYLFSIKLIPTECLLWRNIVCIQACYMQIYLTHLQEKETTMPRKSLKNILYLKHNALSVNPTGVRVFYDSAMWLIEGLWWKKEVVGCVVELVYIVSVFLHFENKCQCLVYIVSFEREVSCFVSCVSVC